MAWLLYTKCFCTQAQSFNLSSSMMHQLSSSPISWHVSRETGVVHGALAAGQAARHKESAQNLLEAFGSFGWDRFKISSHIISRIRALPLSAASFCAHFAVQSSVHLSSQKCPCAVFAVKGIGFPVSTCCNWPVWQALTRRFVTLLRHDRQAVSAHHVHD